MKVPWTEHKTNEVVLKMVETERKIMATVRSRQKRWLGHILRRDSLLRITLEGQIQGKKGYGRPRTMLLDQGRLLMGGWETDLPRFQKWGDLPRKDYTESPFRA